MSILEELASQRVWEEFLAYRLRKGRFNWHTFDEADRIVEHEAYLPMVQHLLSGGRLGFPQKKVLNKMGSGKKRVVYGFREEEMTVLKVLAYLLYRYDDSFAPNCYAFRRGLSAPDALRCVNRAVHGKALWAYKLDIHDYFNSIPVDRLLSRLEVLLSDDRPLYGFFETLLTEDRVVWNGEVIPERHGVFAGTPTAPFLADVYLSGLDHHFSDEGIPYARYSDDIILFAPDRETLEGYKQFVLRYIADAGLVVNPEKERVYSPEEPYEFLGFSCRDDAVDIASGSLRKMKGKIRRKTRSLLRWKKRKGIPPEQAMARLIRYFNRKYFEDGDRTLTWSRWYFPVLTRAEGLREIDHYLQQNLRVLATGRHNGANFRISYDTLKQLGYRSLVHEYYAFRNLRK